MVPVESVPSQTAGNGNSDGEFLVGMIVYDSKRSESGYTYAHIQAVTDAMEAVGLDPDTDLKIRDNITDADTDSRARSSAVRRRRYGHRQILAETLHGAAGFSR